MSDQTLRATVSERELNRVLRHLFESTRPRYQRLWTYYRNPMRCVGVRADHQGSDRPYRQGQEWGLPSRITGTRSGAETDAGQVAQGVARKEVVIENDIGWRVDTAVEYLFGRYITLHSSAPNPLRRQEIGQLLRLILARNGGILFLQQLALVGSIYGFVDVLVKFDPKATYADATEFSGVQDLGAPATEGTGDATTAGPGPAPENDDSTRTDAGPGQTPDADARLQRVARMIRLEIVEPARALPFVSADDWRKLDAYGQVFEVTRPKSDDQSPKRGWLARWLPSAAATTGASETEQGVEVVTPTRWQRIAGGRVIAEGENTLGALPVVHVQNLPVPFQYAGTSDVEPLIPLQDELNTRLSDRANRITMQSFKMYLGKNIDGITDAAVGPGRMWVTDNPDADVVEFGGDGGSSSELSHIAAVREAMDKASGVSPKIIACKRPSSRLCSR